ncbi:FHA domain-containing protein [Occallatibacter savannae]|uniref:FHA domain-containing protein n=1 Tax=Occallatibacter savannae TaxID=1002691 RepID=UPI000D69A98B|nr:FHA domain-containing protein [Occallatibacter savannae]
MSRLQQIEQRIDRALRALLRSSSPEQRREIIEVHRAILEEIGSRVDSLPRGKRGFSYSNIQVQILAEADRRRSYEKVFVDGASLERDIKGYFEDASIEYPANLKIQIELVDDLPPDVKAHGFDVTYSNTQLKEVSAQPLQIRLTLLTGIADQSEYLFSQQRINIGRLSEVLDSHLRPIRRNHVALKDEASGVNATVSRSHAHIEFDAEALRFRLFDDGSAQGTTLFRDGSLITVPKGASKGVLLLDNDEIIVGRVHIRFEYTEPQLH